MNVKEGTRRLAILLGVIGATLGCFVAYSKIQIISSQLALNNEFDQLANSEVVKKAKPDWFAQNSPKQTNDPRKVVGIEVDKGGIKTIHWTKDFAVESLETEDGRTLYPTPAPPKWGYLLITIFPILGFLAPWSSVRAMGWVTAGFVESSK